METPLFFAVTDGIARRVAVMTDDADILARLKAKADEAWAESTRLAREADKGGSFGAWETALRQAREASKRYQAFAQEGKP
jgi:hypothetical protein